jgi:hypothetical protein
MKIEAIEASSSEMLKQQRPHGLRFIRFIQWERCCRFAVPPNAVPGALALSGHDPEFGDGGFMPVFDLAQPFARNRDRRRRHVVGEFCPRAGLVARFEINDHRVNSSHFHTYSNEHMSAN